MKGFSLAVVGCLCTQFALAQSADEAPSVDETIARWQTAVTNCRSFQADVTHYYYSGCWGDEKHEGQFYYESPDSGRLQLNDEVVLWRNGDLYVPFPQESRYLGFTVAYLEATRQEVVQIEEQPWTFFGDVKMSLYYGFARPTSRMLFAPWLDHKDVWRSRCDYTTELLDGKVMLRCVSKSGVRDGVKEWWVLFDPKTDLPEATQQIDKYGDRHVCVFSDVHVNETPANREQLMKLDHPEWKIDTFDWPLERSKPR